MAADRLRPGSGQAAGLGGQGGESGPAVPPCEGPSLPPPYRCQGPSSPWLPLVLVPARLEGWAYGESLAAPSPSPNLQAQPSHPQGPLAGDGADHTGHCPHPQLPSVGRAEQGGQPPRRKGRAATTTGQPGQIFLSHQLPRQVLFLFQAINLEKKKERERRKSKQGKGQPCSRRARPGTAPRWWPRLSPESAGASPSTPIQL